MSIGKAPINLCDDHCWAGTGETGQIMFVDAQQVEWGFEKNNPRLQKISGVYTERQVRAMLAAAQTVPDAARQSPWRGN